MSIDSPPPPTPPMSIDSPPPPTPQAHVDSASVNSSSSMRIMIAMSNKKKAGSDSDGSSSSPNTPYPKKPRVLEGRSLGVDDDGDCDMPTLGEQQEIDDDDDDDDVALPQEEEEDDDRGTSRRRIKLCLPSPLELPHEKEILLKKRNLCRKLQVPTCKDAELTTQLEDFVEASRILHLNKIELYFVEDGEVGPFSPRNELESLNAILSLINSSLPDAKIEEKEVLESLKSSICGKIDEVASEYLNKETFKEYDKPGNELLEWEKDHGVKAKLIITCCVETGKGAEASEDIGIGDTVLEIPYSRILWEDIVEGTDMYDDLKKNDISSKEMFLLWCMKERRDPDSKHKKYFQTLPEEFKTGLNFGVDCLGELGGTPLSSELMEIEWRLNMQFNELCCTFSWIRDNHTLDDYRWAYQLLVAYGMEVVSDAVTKLCLVPVAGFFNHSFCPHILLHESVERESVDHKSKFLIFRASRPCRKGEQCYISYGNHSGHELIKSYGFLPKGLNPYDVLYLDCDCILENTPATEQGDDFGWTTPMVRKIPFPKPPKLPARLMDHLYAKFGVAKDHKPEDIVPIIEELKKLVFYLGEMLMLHASEVRRCSEWKDDGWDLKLVWEYHNLMTNLVCSALTVCSKTIEELGGELDMSFF